MHAVQQLGRPWTASAVTGLGLEARMASMRRCSGMQGATFEGRTPGADYANLTALLGAGCSHLTYFHFITESSIKTRAIPSYHHGRLGSEHRLLLNNHGSAHFTDEESEALDSKGPDENRGNCVPRETRSNPHPIAQNVASPANRVFVSVIRGECHVGSSGPWHPSACPGGDLNTDAQRHRTSWAGLLLLTRG